MSVQKAVILLSGGLDSATALAIAKSVGFETHAISFDYGQRHRIELDLAKRQALSAATYTTINLDLRPIGGSALTADIPIPKGDTPTANEIPVTYVPARNTIFLSIALAKAESIGSTDIFLGVNALDYSGYPDCRPEFIKAFEAMANLATKASTHGAQYDIHVPLINLTKAEIIKRGTDLGVDYGQTSSCYDPGPDGRPCLHCDSCLLRLKGFQEAGLPDPLIAKFGLSVT